jgi:hypothetical protein
LAYTIIRQLGPQLSPKYFARLEKYVVTDISPQLNMGIVYPDLEVWQKPPGAFKEAATSIEAEVALTPPTATLPFIGTLEVNVPIIEIRDKENNELITTIEIISPANKRNPGYDKYVEKQRKLHERGVHLLEIDLIRQGERQYKHPVAVSAHYLVTLLRGNAYKVDVWAIDIKDKLPVLPVPLKSPDADAILNLQKAFDEMYGERLYADSVNYGKTPPPPAFSEEVQKWIDDVLKKNSEE